MYVFVENDLLLLDFPIIVNGFSIEGENSFDYKKFKALLPMEVTLWKFLQTSGLYIHKNAPSPIDSTLFLS